VYVSELSFPKPPEQMMGGMSMMRSMGPELEITEVDAAALVEIFGETMKTLQAMLGAVPDQSDGLELDEAEVSLSISSDGKVAFVGGGGIPGMRVGSSSNDFEIASASGVGCPLGRRQLKSAPGVTSWTLVLAGVKLQFLATKSSFRSLGQLKPCQRI
jgi:hypothetical protein